MSCNGCRVLRKGCGENCLLRSCLQWIESPQGQAHATVFVAKFFGRAGLMSFISAVPESQRSAVFQSLLFEACGRTVNPVGGAVGLLWTGNWQVCQSAVETVLRGDALLPMPEFTAGGPAPESEDASEADVDCFRPRDPYSRSKPSNRKISDDVAKFQPTDLDLCLTSGLPSRLAAGGGMNYRPEKRRPATPSMDSEESETTTLESGSADRSLRSGGRKLLRLFV